MEFEIRTTSKKNKQLIVRFQNPNEIIDALNRLEWMEDADAQKEAIKKIRSICQTEDNRIFYPTDTIKLPTARWAFVAATASFPIGIPVDFVLEKTGLSYNALSSYCTSKKNPSYKYFYIEDGILYVEPEGISWVLGNLKKDRQIEEETKVEEE